MAAKTPKWGIDLEGRRMKFDPWATDESGAYRAPGERERELVYGISGEAVSETLRYFAACGGSVDGLVEALDRHAPDGRFATDAESLLDPTRMYSNEYYFYFVMFAKKLMKDYDWRYTRGTGVQLSVHHKIYEIGFLRYPPYGERIKDDTNSILYGIIKYFSARGVDFTDFYDWAEALARVRSAISYKDVVSKLENYWICSEFSNVLQELLKVCLNRNSMYDICDEVAEYHDFMGFSYVPESILIKAINFIINKTTTVYTLDIRYDRKNSSADFFLRNSPGYDRRKDDVYHASISVDSNGICLASFPKFIKQMLALSDTPALTNVRGMESDECSCTIRWEKRILSVPYVQLALADSAALAAALWAGMAGTDAILPIAAFAIPLNVILVLARRLRLAAQRQKVAEFHIMKMSENNIDRLGRAEDLSREMMLAKEALERKVRERTAELERANERLKELDAAKTNFFANVSHELRTPLTLLLGPLESIMRGEYGDTISCGDEKLGMMLANGSKLLKLINNLLDFSRIEAGKMTLRKTRTDMADLLRHYTSITKTYAENKGLSIVFNDNSLHSARGFGKVVAWIDRDLFEKALFNLLSNALKFTDRGGDVIVQLDGDGDRFTVSVKDTGIGIPEDRLSYVFERFAQVDSSFARKYDGTGIGLSLTSEIVKIMGGEIRVSSEPGAGSVFSISLPRGTGDEQEGDEGGCEPAVKPYLLSDFGGCDRRRIDTGGGEAVGSEARKKILVVEDSVDMQRYLESILEREYAVVTASNGADGLSRAEQHGPDLVLADVMMPGMDGYELTRRIKSDPSLAGIPVILLTAKADAFMKIEGFGHGADDYVVKPFDSIELAARVKAHLAMKELRDEAIRQRNALAEQKAELEHTVEELVQAELRLEKSEKRFREMAELLPSAIVELDTESRVMYANRAGFGLFGFTENELDRGIRFTEFLHAGDRERFETHMREIARSGGDRLYEYRFRSRGGKEIVGLLKSVPLYAENKVSGARATITEVKTFLDLALLPDEGFYGEFALSEREKEVLLLVLKGYKNRDIGEKLFIAERTVKKHMASIFQKTKTSTRNELMRLVREYRVRE